MKDKKFYPMGSKSTNFDALKAGKKPIAKESSPLRVSLDKNKLFASNDFDADRSKTFLIRIPHEQSHVDKWEKTYGLSQQVKDWQHWRQISHSTDIESQRVLCQNRIFWDQ